MIRRRSGFEKSLDARRYFEEIARFKFSRIYPELIKDEYILETSLFKRVHFPLVQAFLMSVLMVSIMTFVITAVNTGFDSKFSYRWFVSWLIAWPIAFAIILFFGRKVAGLATKLCNLD